MRTCKNCGAEIIRIKSCGTTYTCDPEQMMYWETPAGRGQLITPNGELVTCEISGDPNKATGLAYAIHICRPKEV